MVETRCENNMEHPSRRNDVSKKAKTKTYWCGFVDGEPSMQLVLGVLFTRLFHYKKDAEHLFEDVRKVRIAEVKR